MASSYDDIVVGLGAMGSAAAYHLALRGRRVLGLEQFEPGHDRGSSHGGTRMIRQSYFEDPSYVPLVLRSYQLWRGLEEAVGESLLEITGGLYLGPDGCRTVSGARESARRWGLPHEMLDAAEIRRRFPAFAPADGTVGLLEPEAGFLRPERAVLAHVTAARAAGAEIRTGDQVTFWEPTRDGGVWVRTTSGTFRAARLLVTSGAWAPVLLKARWLPLQVERQVQYWFRPADPAAPYAVGAFPCWIWEHDGVQAYGFPAVDGAAPKVGLFRQGTPTTAVTVDRTVHEEEVAQMRSYLAGTLPALATGSLEDAGTCLYTTSPDEHFVIGAHPQAAQVIFATGFSGHGFKFAPVVGEILADLAIDGTTQHDCSLFAPDRFSARPGS